MLKMIPLLLVWVTGCATQAPPASSRGPAAANYFTGPAWERIGFAELEKYGEFWALSDVHGMLSSLTEILKNGDWITAKSSDNAYTLKPGKVKRLLVIAGDMINKGPDSVGVVLRLKQLQEQARKNGDRVVILLGNHEAYFLADAELHFKEFPEFDSSAQQRAKELGLNDKAKPKELSRSAWGDYLRSLPLGAVLGDWLVLHAGFLDTDEPQEFVADVSEAYEKGQYGKLTLWKKTHPEGREDDPRGSVLDEHDWVKDDSKRIRMRKNLGELGLRGVIMGHEPGAMKADGRVAINKSGWVLKLDSGLGYVNTKEFPGLMLRCDMAKLLKADKDDQPTLDFVRKDKVDACRQLRSDGETKKVFLQEGFD